MPVPKPKRPGRGARKNGRPTLMTEERIKRIVQAVQGGAPRRYAAQFAGVGASTLQEWLARGHQGESPYAEFLERIETAEATRVVAAVAKVSQHKDWRAQLSLLERWAPEFRRPPDQVELANPDGSLRPIGVVAAGTEALRLIRELRDLELADGGDRQPSPVREISE